MISVRSPTSRKSCDRCVLNRLSAKIRLAIFFSHEVVCAWSLSAATLLRVWAHIIDRVSGKIWIHIMILIGRLIPTGIEIRLSIFIESCTFRRRLSGFRR